MPETGGRIATALWLGLFGASVLLSLLLLEGGLRLATPFPIDSPKANSVPDPRLGKRMDPALPEIDERGYRNPDGIDRASVVALGDSHTYGYNVGSDQSWPAELSRLIGSPVYNFGIGGFGILQYHDQLRDALALRPERVLVALYLANDVTSICGYPRVPHWQQALAGSDDERRLEASCRTLTRADGQPLESPPAGRGVVPASQSAIRSALRHLVWMPLRSELRIRGLVDPEAGRIPVDDPHNGMLVARNRLIYHARYMNYAEEHPAALADFARQRLRDMQRQAEASGARLGVMLVPTRERVMYPYLIDRGFELPSEWAHLVEVELAATQSFLEFFAEERIDAVDLAPAVAEALEEGTVYPRREDGHPLAAGYVAYARGAYEAFFESDSVAARSPR